jgi:hypothetical protein
MGWNAENVLADETRYKIKLYDILYVNNSLYTTRLVVRSSLHVIYINTSLNMFSYEEHICLLENYL